MCKAVCGTCNYRMPCLRKAVDNRENIGVWGGMGEGERRSFILHLKRDGRGFAHDDDLELAESVRWFYFDNEERYANPQALSVEVELAEYRQQQEEQEELERWAEEDAS